MKDLIIPICAVAFAAAFLVGWIINIIAIASGSREPVTGLMVLRVIGIFIVPLGAVLGYVGH